MVKASSQHCPEHTDLEMTENVLRLWILVLHDLYGVGHTSHATRA